MIIKLESKCPNWRRASVASKIIKLRIMKNFIKQIRDGSIENIKIDKSLNELIWSKGPKNLSKYIDVKIETLDKTLNILPNNAV